MDPKNYQSITPPMPREDKPGTSLIKTGIILVILCICGVGIYNAFKDGTFDEFSELFSEITGDQSSTKLSKKEQTNISDYLAKEYGDSCKYAGAVTQTAFEDKGGFFDCENITDTKVLAYILVADDLEATIYADNYLHAKYFKMTESTFADTIRLYYPEANVNLLDVSDATSSFFDKTLSFSQFVRENGYNYKVTVTLPQGTGISINTNTELANHLSSLIPNYPVNVLYENRDNVLFTMDSTDGEAIVTVH